METQMVRADIEVEGLYHCPLCVGPAIASEFTFPDSTYVELAKIQCSMCGCRITGASVSGLVGRWNNRPS